MPIVLTRIDQRLIHGITVNQWNKVLHPKRFMVVDDEISNNELVKASMRMGKPAGTGMSIISIDDAIKNFKAGKYDTHSVFLIVKEPRIILDLVNAGIEIKIVNVGALFEEKGRKPYTNHVAMNDQEVSDLKKIASKNIRVFFEYTPDDENEIELEAVLKNKEE